MGKQNLKTIFDQALEIDQAEQRLVFLDETCADAPELRLQVDALLKAYEAAGRFLESPAVLAPTLDVPALPGPGTVIGQYKLLQQIGEGGFGTVFMAQQTEPVQRKVALKIIKPGMDARQVVARFEAERQALAIMDHPNIAKVLDGGTIAPNPKTQKPNTKQTAKPEIQNQPDIGRSDLGFVCDLDFGSLEFGAARPFFVMELVKGVPITKYCDQHHLTLTERLQLFVPVCQAVQHAHQKGIIHRDLKPSNVLIAQYDGKPVPKVIDFGVAKATGQTLTDRTLFTEFGQVVGTFEYMSPEQAELNQLDIDTRSDIYSLGVLLYELLTGTTPLQRDRVKNVGLLEVLRMIREDETPRPSTRLSDTWKVEREGRSAEREAQSAPSGARNGKGVSRSALRALRFYELDWIVMKALEKDRNRRYETASGLARDIERYLDDEPVQACPPSAGYRLRKFVRRNKRALVTVGTVVLAVFLAIGISTWRIWLAKEDAEAARQDAEATREVADQKRRLSDANLALADDVLDQIYLDVAERGLLKDPQREDENTDLLQKALTFYVQFAETNAADPQTRFKAGRAYVRAGKIQATLDKHEDAQRTFRRSIELLEQVPIDSPLGWHARAGVADAYNEIGRMYRSDLRYADAEKAHRQAHEIHLKLNDAVRDVPAYRSDLAAGSRNLGLLLVEVDEQSKEGEKLLQLSRETYEALARAYPNNAWYQMGLAGGLNTLSEKARDRGDLEEALQLHQRSVAHQQAAIKVLKNPRYRTRLCEFQRGLAVTLQKMKKYDEALKVSDEMGKVAAQVAREFPRVPDGLNYLSMAYGERAKALEGAGRIAEANQAHKAALDTTDRLVKSYADRPVYQYNLAVSQRDRAELLAKIGQTHEAEAAFRQALKLFQSLPDAKLNLPSYRREVASISLDLGDVLWKIDKFEESEKLLGQTVELYRALDKDFPDVPAYRWALVRSYSKLAISCLSNRQAVKTEEAVNAALPLIRKFIDDFPKELQCRHELGNVLNTWGFYLKTARRFEEAEKAFRQSLEVRTKLAEELPGTLDQHNSSVTQRDIAICHYNLGVVYNEMEQYAKAMEAYNDARRIQKKVVLQAPDVAEFQSELAGTFNNQGMLFLRKEEWSAARSHFQEAVRHVQGALKVDPDVPRYQRALAKSFGNLGDVLVKLGDHAALAKVGAEFPVIDWLDFVQAADYLIFSAELAGKDAKTSPAERAALAGSYAEQARDKLRQAAGRCPDTPQKLFSLGKRLDSFARRLDEAGCRMAAIETLRESIAIMKKHPDQADAKSYVPWLAGRLRHLGFMLERTSQLREAEVAYVEALPHLEKLVKDHPQNHARPHELGLALNNLALLLRGRGEPAEARRRLEQAITSQQTALALDRGNQKYAEMLCTHHGNLAQTLIVLGDHSGAAKAALEQPKVQAGWRMHASAAVLISQCLPAVEKDKRLSAQERTAQSQAYVAKARELLREAVRLIPDDPMAQNMLAWLLVASEERRLHDPAIAIELANKATARAPKIGGYWHTLGLAHYRAGDWQAAIKALDSSVSLEASGHFVLAMAHWQLAVKQPEHKETAHECFRRGVAWMGKNKQPLASDEDALSFRRLQAEAATLLRIHDETTSTSKDK